MLTIKILLDSIEKIKLFIDDINKLHIDYTLHSGRHSIPSREITFLFCLNIYEPITLKIQTLNEDPSLIFDTLRPYFYRDSVSADS